MRFNPPRRVTSKGERKSINISMPPILYDAIHDAAKERGYNTRTGKAEFVRMMIQHCLEDLNKGQPGRKAKPAYEEAGAEQD